MGISGLVYDVGAGSLPKVWFPLSFVYTAPGYRGSICIAVNGRRMRQSTFFLLFDGEKGKAETDFRILPSEDESTVVLRQTDAHLGPDSCS